MNIFILGESPKDSAIFQHDRHVVKMILESCQMLSTASLIDDKLLPLLEELDISYDSFYKSTHMNHPCNVWLRESRANFVWLTIHLDALLVEYQHRFPGRVHKCSDLRYIFAGMSARIADLPHFKSKHRIAGFYSCDSSGNLCVNPAIQEYAAQHTPFPVCMAESYQLATAVDSYRNYYVQCKIRQDHVKWTNRPVPFWLNDYCRSAHDSQLVERLIDENRQQRFAGVKTVRQPRAPRPYVPPVFNDSDYANPDLVKMPTSFRIR